MRLSELLKQIKPYVLGWARPRFMPFAAFDALPNGITTSPKDVFSGATDVEATFRRWTQWVYVAATNDGSNYWSVALVSNTGTTIATVTTASEGADAWKGLAVTGLSSAALSNKLYVIRATKIGAPGALLLGAPAVWVE